MAWVRLDDGFAVNGKIAQLSDPEFRTWVRLLCHCGKVQDPTVDKVTVQEVVGLTPKRVDRYAELRLLDPIDDDYEVHDWEQYQPKDVTGAERQARWRARNNAKRNAGRNGGNVTNPVTETVT